MTEDTKALLSYEDRMALLEHYDPKRNIRAVASKVLSEDWMKGITANVPMHMQDDLLTYILVGLIDDDFLLALVQNDFMGAMTVADDTNKRNIYGWAVALYNYAPSECFRSPEKVGRWIERGGMLGPPRRS